ncbi:terpene synthase family protein [Spirillospora sp. CA-253888]
MTLTSDTFSYCKEVEFEREGSNLVVILRSFLGHRLQEALDLVGRLRNARIRRFSHVVEAGLPVMFGLDGASRALVTGYAARLQDYISRVITWHESVSRYRNPPARLSALANG